MKEILVPVAYIIGIAELILAGYFLKTNSGNIIRKVMVLLAFSTGTWVILTASTAYVDLNNFSILRVRLVYIFGLLLITNLVQLALRYPFPAVQINWLHNLLLYIPVIILTYSILFTDTVLSGFVLSNEYYGRIIPGQLHVLYNTYLGLLFVFSLSLLIYKIKRVDGMNKINLTIFLWSLLLGGLPGIFIDIVLTSTRIFLSPLIGVISSIVWLGGTTYIIVRK